MTDKVTKVEYRCLNPKCNNVDHVKLWPNEAAPPMINCGQCHAGYGVNLDEMIQSGVGMAMQMVEVPPTMH